MLNQYYVTQDSTCSYFRNLCCCVYFASIWEHLCILFQPKQHAPPEPEPMEEPTVEESPESEVGECWWSLVGLWLRGPGFQSDPLHFSTNSHNTSVDIIWYGWTVEGQWCSEAKKVIIFCKWTQHVEHSPRTFLTHLSYWLHSSSNSSRLKTFTYLILTVMFCIDFIHINRTFFYFFHSLTFLIIKHLCMIERSVDGWISGWVDWVNDWVIYCNSVNQSINWSVWSHWLCITQMYNTTVTDF